MNIEVPISTAALARPALPVPALSRWQPLRIGLVELFHYDSEEFWFRDGRLLLKGNNGTGKSKVLSLTLPFLFDAQIKSSRIEPDGDPGKRMAWNLLLGRHDRRIGYAWIEFGHLSDGGPRYLTLGAGLSAAAGRPEVDSWFFVLEDRRVGEDLWLTSPQRVVLTRERLKEAIGERGQVFETAIAYRRAVDERLFRLGPARYAALIDTLIQLRQPQLSKKPDEASLSAALTEALPPLASDLLNDVAEALNQLEEDRRQLEEYEQLARAVADFNQRYTVYAATQTRRQARNLRMAQTGFDHASRALNEARTSLQTAASAEAEAEADRISAEDALRAGRARLETLQADPVNRDANRLELAKREAEDRLADAHAADRLSVEADRRLSRESGLSQQRRERAADAEQSLADGRRQLLDFAAATGVSEGCAETRLCTSTANELAGLSQLAIDTERENLQRLATNRREQVAQVRRRRAESNAAEQAHAVKLRLRDEYYDQLGVAAERRAAADAAVERQGSVLCEAWQNHLDGLKQLRIDDVATPLAALAHWVLTAEGENPALAALATAQQLASERLAERQVALNTEAGVLQTEEAELRGERDELESGRDPLPPSPVHRAPDTRTDRAGAPLWQLVEFRSEIADSDRAGLEAALEAAGLLDAWLTPDGQLSRPDGQPLHDTQLVIRPPAGLSLSAWLEPAGSAVAVEVVATVLAGIAFDREDDGEAETWVSPDGRFRVGALAGAWSKPVPLYIGQAARAAARAWRLEAIAARLAELASLREELRQRVAAHAEEQRQAAAEWRNAPPEQALRAAHAEARSCAQSFLYLAARLDEAEAELTEATNALRRAHETLARDARDLRLPEDDNGLREVEQGLIQLGESFHEVFRAVGEVRSTIAELDRQREREDEARRDADGRRSELSERRSQAGEAKARFQTLLEAVGSKVEELQRRLAEARLAVNESEARFTQAIEARRVIGESRARCQQKVEDTAATLQERSGVRQQAIAALQAFARTGLLATALPETEVPDLATPWTIEPALNLARRAEQALADTKDDEEAWNRIQARVSQDYTELLRTLTALGHQAQAETSDYGLVVSVIYQNRPERPDRLSTRLEAEIADRRELLSAREREILENHLQAEIASAIQKLLQDAERQVHAVNKELEKRPTSTGVRFRLVWEPLPEGSDAAPVGLEAARKRLLNKSADLWSAEDRRVVGAMLQQRIASERADEAASSGSLLDQLAKALDYRRWHRFLVQRWQDGEWRKLSGPASSGERALGLTVPLFAAVASFYSQSGFTLSPRLVLLDEAFAGIDDAARAHCMGLVREFDLDFVITSEREWGCYAELPGVSICHLQRQEGVDAVYVSRWTWDGNARRRASDPDRRFAEVAD